MRVAVGSAFRNCAPRTEGYAARVGALAKILSRDGHTLRVVAAAGDCADDTVGALARSLRRRTVPVTFVPCDHGLRHFGSTEEPERLAALTMVGNAILGGVRADDDLLLYVESDLEWRAETALALLGIADITGHVVAPMVWAGELFYDVWGFRAMDGSRFSPFPPHSRALAEAPARELVEVGSAGSCLAMPAAVARGVRMPPGGCLVGFCEEARRAGRRVMVAPWLSVAHPC